MCLFDAKSKGTCISIFLFNISWEEEPRLKRRSEQRVRRGGRRGDRGDGEGMGKGWERADKRTAER